MVTEVITLTTKPVDADTSGQPEPAGQGGEAERSAAPGPFRAAKADESHDFPYFEFYPYGYLY